MRSAIRETGGTGMLGVRELFDAAQIEMLGPVPWGTQIPEWGPGVYVITVAEQQGISTGAMTAAQLGRWHHGQEIVYIGRAGNLRKRVDQFYKHKYGDPKPHSGGQDILLLDCALQVFWGTAADFSQAEDKLIERFRREVGAFPFANRMRSARRRTPLATSLSEV